MILIDGLLATFLDPGPSAEVREHGSGQARLQTLKLLRSLPAGEKIAIYATGRAFRVVCEFTSDRHLLEQELGKWKPGVDNPDTVLQPIQEVIGLGGGRLKGVDLDAVRKLLGEAARIDMAERLGPRTQRWKRGGPPGWDSGAQKPAMAFQPLRHGRAGHSEFNRASVSLYLVDMDGICQYCAPRPIEIMNATPRRQEGWRSTSATL